MVSLGYNSTNEENVMNLVCRRKLTVLFRGIVLTYLLLASFAVNAAAGPP